MFRLQFRGSIAGAAVVVALLWSRPVAAQYSNPVGPPEPGGLVNEVITGVAYDRVNQKLAFHRLEALQEKLRLDTERCDSAAVERDLRQIENLRYRISIDEWLIRKNSLLEPTFYPAPIRLDALSCWAIANASRPPQTPYPSQLSWPPSPAMSAPTITITLVNTESTGPGIAFAIDGATYQSSAGSRQDYTAGIGSIITYDGGGTLGQSRYRLSPGVYEFRSTPQGWALYKMPITP
jgi:hypothetical protein